MIRAALLLCIVLVSMACLSEPVSGARGAASCSSVTVDGGQGVGKLTLRLVLIGRVSCTKAHRLVRAYYRKMATDGCGEPTNRCILHFPRGWTCSVFSFGESQTTDGAMAGCARGTSGAKIRVFAAGAPGVGIARCT